VYFVLGLAALGCATAWWMTRRGKYVIGAGVALGLILLVMLLDRWVVTDQERVVQNIQVMAASVEARDMERAFSLVSDRFHWGAADKREFRKWAESRIREGDVTDIRVWDFSRATVDRDHRTATIEFLVKGRGAWVRGGEFFRCKAKFFQDADDEWRLAGFELFQPHQDPNLASPLPIPLLPR
jgi:hypothetical protein